MSGPTSCPSPWILWHWAQSLLKTAWPATGSPGVRRIDLRIWATIRSRCGLRRSRIVPQIALTRAAISGSLLCWSWRSWLTFSADGGILLVADGGQQGLASRRGARSGARWPGASSAAGRLGYAFRTIGASSGSSQLAERVEDLAPERRPSSVASFSVRMLLDERTDRRRAARGTRGPRGPAASGRPRSRGRAGDPSRLLRGAP